jgi:mannan endo-1,4-beta-mannosidase
MTTVTAPAGRHLVGISFLLALVLAVAGTANQVSNAEAGDGARSHAHSTTAGSTPFAAHTSSSVSSVASSATPVPATTRVPTSSSAPARKPATTPVPTTSPALAVTPTTAIRTPSPSPNSSPSSHFVERSGTTLRLDGQPYRFSGINIYMAASGGTASSCGGALYPDVGVPLSHMPNGIVFRFWAFQNFFVSNGSFNWANLDRVLAIAAAHHDKVIPVLANQYSYCDGAGKDLAWYARGYRGTVGRGDVLTYRSYVAKIVQRYANNPTVAMWQLVNEGQAVNSNGSCNETAALSALLSFSNDVGSMVHGLDPNHLVSLGTLAGYSGSGHQWCGAANADYQALMASPGTDVCDFHDYGYPSYPMGMPVGPNLAQAIQRCHANGKPIMVAETGIFATSSAQLASRAAQFKAKFAAQLEAGVVGELMWTWTVKPAFVLPAQDPDYGIFPGDPSLGVLGPV